MISLTVLISKSVCMDCIWRKTCQKLERLNGGDDKRNNPGHTNDIFELIILTCSTKNYDRSYKTGDDNKKNSGMYYCTECGTMHHEWSSIGRSHKRVLRHRIP